MRVAGTYNAPWAVILSASLFRAVPSVYRSCRDAARRSRSGVRPGDDHQVERTDDAEPALHNDSLRRPEPRRWPDRRRNVRLANIERLEVAFDVFYALNGETFRQFKSGGNQTYNANFGRAADRTMQG